MKYQFCSIFKFKGRVFIERIENAGGPGCAIFPPKELNPTIDTATLGNEIESALSDYRDLGRSIYAEEWEERNKQLLNFFDEKSVAEFERKKKDVTVRRETATESVVLFGSKGEEVIKFETPSRDEIGQKVKELLALK